MHEKSYPPPGLRLPKRATVPGLALLLCGLTLTLYFPSIGHDFINFDDPEYITKNPRMALGLTLANVGWAFGTWHPLTWISLLLDVSIFGLGPRGFHTTNVLLHAANAGLAFVAIHKLTGSVWRSLIVAALFAWHPVQVESVAWVSERKGVLSACFGFMAIWAYARYAHQAERQAEETGAVHSRLRFHAKPSYWLALGLFAMALLSKPMLVTLPLLLLLLDVWPLGRFQLGAMSPGMKKPRHLWLEKCPFLALALLSGIVTSLFQKDAGAMQTLGGYSLGSRVENLFIGYAHYLGKTIWPVSLATPYPRVFHWPMQLVVLAALLLILASTAAVWFKRTRAFLFTGWFWFVLMLFPVMGLFQVGAAAVADRYAYLPMLGLFVLVVWSAGEIFNSLKFPKALTIAVAVIVLVACAMRTRDQLHYWQNSGTLFEHAVAVSRDNWIAHQLLGVYYDELGRKEEAFLNFKRVTEIKPNYAEAWNSLGVAWTEKRDFAQAAACFESAVKLSPEVAGFRYNFARALGVVGRAPEAIAAYREVLKLDPGLATAHNDLGILLAKTGHFDEAIGHLQETLRLNPDNPLAHYHLGKLLAASGRKAEAIPHFRAAVKLKPDFAEAHAALRALGVTDGN